LGFGFGLGFWTYLGGTPVIGTCGSAGGGSGAVVVVGGGSEVVVVLWAPAL
jgi:hypothetical protein